MPDDDRPKRPGILELVSRAEGGPFYTIRQVATMIGRDPDTIRRWQKKKDGAHLAPEHKMDLGDGSTDSFVWLYTAKDVENYRAYAKTVKVGRPPKQKED